ncbi:hypothetical protein AAT18_08110 [Rhodococcus aetherivorans]|nr:hypothetical protein AAT18_08110 [Rhodococcus aetherivorans]
MLDFVAGGRCRSSGYPDRSGPCLTLGVVTSPAAKCVFGVSRSTTRMLGSGASRARCAAWVSSWISLRSSSGLRPSAIVTSMNGIVSLPRR